MAEIPLITQVGWLLRKGDPLIRGKVIDLIKGYQKKVRVQDRKIKELEAMVSPAVFAYHRAKELLITHNVVSIFYSIRTGKFFCYTELSENKLESPVLAHVGTYTDLTRSEQFYSDADITLSEYFTK